MINHSYATQIIGQKIIELQAKIIPGECKGCNRKQRNALYKYKIKELKTSLDVLIRHETELMKNQNKRDEETISENSS